VTRAGNDSLAASSGIAVPSAERSFVRGASGTVQMLHLESGDLVAEADIDARPAAADAHGVLVVRVPTIDDRGEVALIGARERNLVVTNQTELIDASTYREIGQWVDSVATQAHLDEHRAILTADVHTRYTGGAAPSEDLLEEANAVHRFRIVIDRQTGATIEHDHTRLGPTDVALELTPQVDSLTVVDVATGSESEPPPPPP